jgi:hypothetical protein
MTDAVLLDLHGGLREIYFAGRAPSLYRVLGCPAPDRGSEPPDTLTTRTIETIDNDCGAGLFFGSGLPPA